MQKEKLKIDKGITLIALIITIIVMLILVGVTVSVALNGGLFNTAKDAANQTQIEVDREELLSAVVAAFKTDGTVDFSKLPPSGWTGSDGTYTSLKGNTFTVTENGEITHIKEGEKPAYKTEIAGLAEGVSVVPYDELTGDIKTAVDDGKIQTVLKETINGTETIAVVPTGFEISTVDGENSISGGLVIKDGANEFVFIPCTDSYTEDNLGPLTVIESITKSAYDSQEYLDYYYGEGYYNYSEDFNYEQDKTDIETSINKYKGFYVGRYETTIDESGNIGSMRNTTVLTSDKKIAQTNNKEGRWHGLYKVQKDMYKENKVVFSTMITSKEWEKIMNFTGYGSAKRPTNTYTTKPDLSGSAYKDNNPAQYDVSKNIYDMAGNVDEYTLKAYVDSGRGWCGISYSEVRFTASMSGWTTIRRR